MATNLEVFSERLERQQKEREAFLESVSPKNYKANLISCPGCGSKIAKRFFEGTDCPLCGESMLSETNKDRLRSFDARIATTASNLRKAQESAAKRNGTPIEGESQEAEAEEDTTAVEEASDIEGDTDGE